ncbi:hypothetical protein BDL97_15G007000 [Sphagnum fallax]|nr:hypothetical protein BDL97_15G007000 [Sphagnum fallax]
MAEWSKAPDSSSGLRKGAWVRTPLLTEEGNEVIYSFADCFGVNVQNRLNDSNKDLVRYVQNRLE